MISVIIVVRNEERNIVKMLESLRNQSKRIGEIIIVDENSRDGTREVVRNYSDKFGENG